MLPRGRAQPDREDAVGEHRLIAEFEHQDSYGHDMREYRLGHIAHLKLSGKPSAPIGLVILWAILSGAGIALLNLSAGEAILGGLIAMLLHSLSELVHQLGHAWAAQRTGHPMIGITFWLVLASSIYPADEEPLPASIHIRRALGGPFASSLLTVIAGIIFLAARTAGGVLGWVALFFFLDNLFVFTLQVLLPLGFNDGYTIWRWWRK